MKSASMSRLGDRKAHKPAIRASEPKRKFEYLQVHFWSFWACNPRANSLSNCLPHMNDNFTRLSEVDWGTLIERIRDGKCTPFLGAGASYSCDRSRYGDRAGTARRSWCCNPHSHLIDALRKFVQSSSTKASGTTKSCHYGYCNTQRLS